MTTIAIVPMKGHSARVPRKNLKPMCGRPLYHWITRTLMAVNGIDRVVIETDADEIAADVATHFPDLQVLRRPERLHGDEVPMNAILDNAMAQLEPGATFVQSHSTNPLLKPATVEKGRKMMDDICDAIAAEATEVFRQLDAVQGGDREAALRRTA